ncbi:MarR family winged helix-turn-helix transcriptional regulator [Patulibacter sp. S7RM1-6]
MSDAPHAPVDAASLGELLSRAARAIHAQSRELLAPLGMTPAEARALRTLARDGAPLRMVELAERMHVVPRTVTTLVDALEQGGLIERRPDPSDRRSTLVQLTPRGEERLDEMRRARRDAAGQLLSALDADEQAQLRALLKKLDADALLRRRC